MPLPIDYQQEIDRIVEQLRDGYHPDRILLFGSCARGDVHRDSDIDLLVVKRTTKRWIDRFVEARTKIDTHLPVDVFVYTPEEVEANLAAHDPLFRTIMAEAKVLYDARAA